MNIVGAAASSEHANTYTALCTYLMLYYAYTFYSTYECVSIKSAFVGTTKSTLYFTTRSVTHTYSFECASLQQRQHVDQWGVALLFLAG